MITKMRARQFIICLKGKILLPFLFPLVYKDFHDDHNWEK